MLKYLIISFLIVGCAFKGSETSSPGEASAPVASAQSTNGAEVSWENSEGKVAVQRSVFGEKNFSIPDPVTLPPELPDSIKIKFNKAIANEEVLDEPRVFITDYSDGTGAAPPLRIKGSLGTDGLIVSGLKVFFPTDQQKKGIVKVVLTEAVTGFTIASFTITLVTTPRSAEVSIIQRQDFPDLKKLEAPQLRLDLLFALKVTNSNAYRAEFQMPSTLTGNIQKDFSKYDVFQDSCFAETSVKRWTEKYETQFFVLPMDEIGPRNWEPRKSDQKRVIVLGPGESRVVGIFASGSTASSFIDNGCPAQNAAKIRVQLACRTCEDARNSPIQDEGPCSDGPMFGDVEEGVETAGAYWVLDEVSTILRARNAFLNQVDDPATRSFPFLQSKMNVF